MEQSISETPRWKAWLAGYRRLNRFWIDVWAMAVAAALPWSSSASSVLIAIWLFAVVTSLDADSVRRLRITAAGLLPLLLWLFAAVGMLWADVAWADRFDGLRAYHKLALIPFVLVHCARSERAWMVPVAFLASCGVLLGVSLLFTAWPGLTWRWSTLPGLPVRDAIAQSGEFVLCAFAALAVMVEAWRRDLRLAAAGLGTLAVLLLVDVFFVVTSRTALATIPVLALVLGLRLLGWKRSLVIVCTIIVFVAAVWTVSPYVRSRVADAQREVSLYAAKADTVGAGQTSIGERIAYWKKSIAFVREAPAIGHGTGSTPELFRRSTFGRTGLGAFATRNPHNQTLAVAIELGLIGVILLWAVWTAHLLLFRGPGLVATLGLLVVVQNIVSSLFNSHLADFSQGWIYVFGVGALGGMVLRGMLWRGGTTDAGR